MLQPLFSFFLFILLFCVLLMIKNVCRYFLRKKAFDFPFKKKSFDQIIKEAKTGDIILFKYCPGSYRYEFWYDTFVKFNHIGMIYVDEKTQEKYFIENLSPCYILNNESVENVVFSKLKDRLYLHDYYNKKDTLYHCSITQKISKTQNEYFGSLIPTIKQQITFKYYFLEDIISYNLFYHSFGIVPNKHTHNNSFNCAEFTCFCLEKLNVLQRDCNWLNLSVMDVLHLQSKQNNVKLFNSPYEIVF